MRRPLYAIVALIAAAGGGPASAQAEQAGDGIGSPVASRRIAQQFDFEPMPGDSTGLPPNWIRAQHDPPGRIRPGFPIWNRGTIDPTVAYSGNGSVRLDTEGGSASLLLDPGVIQVFPDADYAVVTRVRTLGVDHARARMTVRLIDRNGAPIPGSEVTSEPVATDGEWIPLSVRIPGDFDDSSSLQIELLLEQPGPDPAHPFSPFEIERQDFQGSAWFDDLAVLQIPRVEVSVEQPGNFVGSDETPRIDLFVRDLVSEPLKISYILSDIDGTVVAEETVDFDGGRLETRWEPKIARHGWFRATVAVLRDGVRIGSAGTSFVWAPARSGTGARPSARSSSPFSISIGSVPDAGLAELGELALLTRTPRVLTSLVDGEEPVTPERLSEIDNLANRLAREGSEIGLAIESLPSDVSAVSGPSPVLRAMADGTADGADWLEPMLVDLGHRIRWWRTGAFDESLDALALSYTDRAVDRLRGLVPGAVLELPWSSFDAVDPDAVRSGLAISQRIDPSVIPDEVTNLVGSFDRASGLNGPAGWERPEHTAVLSVAPGADQRAGINEAVLNAVHAWIGFDSDSTGPARGRSLRLHDGWMWQKGRRPQLVPSPAAAVWPTLMDMLAGRRAERIERVAPGVRGVLLTPLPGATDQAESVAMFWPERGPVQADSLTLLLSPERVRVSDVLGNRSTVEAQTLENSSVRAHRIDLSPGVVFVEGVDGKLLRFLSSVHLSPSRVQSDTDPHTVELAMRNPWDSSVQGEYFIVEPGNLTVGTRATQDRRWDISPRFGSFAIREGASADLPVVFDVSPAVPAGDAMMVVDLDLSAPTVSEFVRVERTIEVGLENITMHLIGSYEPDPAGQDIVVYAIIENTGTVAENISLSVSAEGYSRQRAAPTPAYPGRRLIKAFPFPDGRTLLAGKNITAGLSIRESGERLRSSIMIDDGR